MCMCMCMRAVGVGFCNGTLQVLDAITLTDVSPPFRSSREAITQIAFSYDSKFMATAVSVGCVWEVHTLLILSSLMSPGSGQVCVSVCGRS